MKTLLRMRHRRVHLYRKVPPSKTSFTEYVHWTQILTHLASAGVGCTTVSGEARATAAQRLRSPFLMPICVLPPKAQGGSAGCQPTCARRMGRASLAHVKLGERYRVERCSASASQKKAGAVGRRRPRQEVPWGTSCN